MMDQTEFFRLIETLPLVDHHAHNVALKECQLPDGYEQHLFADQQPPDELRELQKAFSKNYPIEIACCIGELDALRDTPTSLCYKRTVRELCRFYGVESPRICTPDLLRDVLAAKCQRIARIAKESSLDVGSAVVENAKQLFKDAKIAAVFIDDGLCYDFQAEVDQILAVIQDNAEVKKPGSTEFYEDVDGHEKYFPIENAQQVSALGRSAFRLIRVEKVAQSILKRLLIQELGKHGKNELALANADYAAVLHEFTGKLHVVLRSLITTDQRVVGLKSIIAYRSGLAVGEHSVENILSALRTLASQLIPPAVTDSQDALPSDACRAVHDLKLRLNMDTKCLNDYIFLEVLKLAAELNDPATSGGATLPIQLHTGLGDTDIRLELGNPVLLRHSVLINHAFRNVPIILLHGAWPYTQEAAYLSSVFSNVYLDISDLGTRLSGAANRRTLHDALSIAPTNKLLLATDAVHMPEMYFAGASLIRRDLADTLNEHVQVGDCTFEEAAEIARDMLYRNSSRLYTRAQLRIVDA